MLETIEKACLKQIEERKLGEEYSQRLKTELDYIRILDRADYIIDLKKKVESGEVTKRPNRNGLVFAYLLGITDIDPVSEEIPHNKYLSDPPDIDIDLSENAKAVVEELLIAEHGPERVAHIYTTNLFSPKSTLRDLCRLMSLTTDQVVVKALTEHFGTDVGEGNEFDSQIERFLHMKKNEPERLDEKLINFLDGKPQYKSHIPKNDQKLTNGELLFKYARKLSGQVSHTGKHPAGVAISSEPFHEFAPLKKVKGEILLALQEGGHNKEVSTFGCLKYDWLGLKNVTKHVHYYQQAKELYGVDLYEKLIYLTGYDDEETLQVFDKGETLGVFQFSGKDLRACLRRARIKSFEDVAIMNAIFRPGPLNNLNALIKNMHNPESVEYEHPAIAPVLKSTYGIIVYQEQVMQIMQVVGGMTGAEADKARSVLKKLSRNKSPDKNSIEYYEYQKMLQKFQAGARRNGLTASQAEKFVHDLSGHMGYSFNKSHATAYGVTAYVDAFFKAHYPLIFYKVLLDYEADRSMISTLIQDARMRGITVQNFDINRNEFEFKIDVEADELLIGYNMVKGVRKTDIRAIMKYRDGYFDGAFKSLDEFLIACEMVKPTITTVRALVKLGALDEFESNRKRLLAIYEGPFSKYLAKKKNKTEKGRWTIEQMWEAVDEMPELEPFTNMEKIGFEFELLEMYISDGPLDHAENFLRETKGVRTTRISSHDSNDTQSSVIGVIASCTVRKTRNGTNYLDMTLTDMVETINVKVWSDKMRPDFQNKGEVLLARLTYQRDFDSYTLNGGLNINSLEREHDRKKAERENKQQTVPSA